MTTDKNNPQTWFSVRAKEPEFLEFLEVSSAEAAVAAARCRCANAEGEIAMEAFEKLKAEFLAFVGKKWSLPSNAGII